MLVVENVRFSYEANQQPVLAYSQNIDRDVQLILRQKAVVVS